MYIFANSFLSIAIQLLITLLYPDLLRLPAFYTIKTNLSVFLTMFLNLLNYSVLIILLVGVCFPLLKKDYKIHKKNFVLYTAVGFFGLILMYGGNFIGSILLIILGQDTTSVNQETVQVLVGSYFLPMFFITVIIAPLAEELVFRKCIFGLIDNKWIALAVSSLSFGLIHVVSGGDFINCIPYVLCGISLGLIYIFSNKNIYISITTHALNNLISILLIMLLY